jgi:glutaminase
MGEGPAAMPMRVGLPVKSGWGGILITHNAGSVTTQSIAFKCEGF